MLAHSLYSYIGNKRLRHGAILAGEDGVTLSNSMVHGLGRYERIGSCPVSQETRDPLRLVTFMVGLKTRGGGPGKNLPLIIQAICLDEILEDKFLGGQFLRCLKDEQGEDINRV